MSTAHHVRAPSRKEESNYDLAILSAAILLTGFTRVEVLVVVQISRSFLATELTTLLTTLLTASVLATLLAPLSTTSR